MKQIRYIVALLSLLILVGACKSGSEFRVINRCSFPAYVALDDGELQTIPGGEEYTFKIDTETQSFLTGEISREMTVRAFGQTYSIINDINQAPQDTTVVILKAGKSLDAYLHPNRACIMIQNNRDNDIARVEIWRFKHNSIEHQRIITLRDIASGEEVWERVLPMASDSPGESFYYMVYVYEGAGSEAQIFGDPEDVLYKDQRWVLTLE